MIIKKGSKWCVVQDDDNTDKGKVIKCYSFKKFGKLGAHKRALKMNAKVITKCS